MRLDSHEAFVRRHHLSPLGAWLVRRHWLVVGLLYVFTLPVYAVVGWWRGMVDATMEWRDDRDHAMALAKAYRDEVER